MIEVQDLHHAYLDKTPERTVSLRGVSLEVKAGEAVGLTGPSGSGKSTLVQHFNGLIRPQRGSVSVGGRPIPRGGDARWARREVGLLFQFPEYQLFGATVEEDVGFGPAQFGVLDKDLVRSVLSEVGLDPGEVAGRSPFELSGGQKRLVALAGVMALRPRCLVLDEPTAGLDPAARRSLLEALGRWRAEGLTLVVISHDLEELAAATERILLLVEGRVVEDAEPMALLSAAERLSRWGLEPPPLSRLAHEARRRGLAWPGDAVTPAGAERAALSLLQSAGR